MPDCLDLIQRAGGSSKYWILPAHAWPGGYPLTYYTANFDSLCQSCAQTDYLEWLYTLTVNQRDLPFAIGYDDPPVHVDIHWEGPAEICAGCNKVMEAAYGDPWEGQDNA